MIIFLLYTLIVSLFILDYLYAVLGIGIRAMTWLPELISIAAALLIPFQTAMNKTVRIPVKYSLLLIIYFTHIALGFLLNDVTGWTILSGTRIYTKFIPIFLIPIVFPLTEKEFKRMVKFIFILAMIQFPVVLFQRFVLYAESLSGDPMGGTLGHSASGVLAIFLLSVMSFLIAFYYKQQLSLPMFLMTFTAAFIPLTLNETKITFFLLPFAFLIPSFFVQIRTEIIVKLSMIFLVLLVSFMALQGIYDYFQTKRWGYGIVTFMTMPGRAERYSRRRLDPLIYSFTHGVSEDIRFMAFGRGAGNVSEGFTRLLDGKYLQQGRYYGVGDISFNKLMWEIGLFGTLLYLMFPFFIFMDGVRLSRRKEGFLGAFSLGMTSYSVFFTLSLFYTFTLDSNVLTYLFYLLGGCLVGVQGAESKESGLESVSPSFQTAS